MKKIGLLLIIAVSIISCKKDGYEVSVTANGIDNGVKAYLETQTELGPIAIDTAVVENGKFKFEGKLKEGMELGFVRVESLNGSIPMIIEDGSITVEINKDTLQNSRVGGTSQNEKFQSYNNDAQVVYKKMMKFQQENQQKMTTAQQSNDTVVVNALMKEYNKFNDEMNENSKKFITKNPDALLSVLILESFLRNNNLKQEEIKSFYDKLDKSILETKSGKNVTKMIEALTNVTIGKKAPDFSAPSPDGKTISLKESLGKVTIIDFWASWCGPCRAENPNVVALYNEFHSQGLNIIGVSLDKENGAADWKQAIEKDKLTWNHVSNLKHWKEPIAATYNVKSIPATFILDSKGVIVAKDIRGEELKAKVKELLGIK